METRGGNSCCPSVLPGEFESVHILQVHTRYRLAGGEDAVVATEAELLRRNGHRLEAFAADNPPGPAAAGYLALSAWNPLAAADFRRRLESVRPDVVHFHNTWFALSPSVVVAASRLGFPTVLTLHNYRLTCANAQLLRDGVPCRLCVEGSAWNGLRYRCYRGTLASAAAALTVDLHRRWRTWSRHVDVFVVLTEFAKRIMVAAGLPSDRIVVKPNFVEDPGPRTLPAEESSVLLFVGRLSEEKGILTLLEAWRLAHSDSFRLKVIGDGPLAGLRRQPPWGVTFTGRLTRRQVWEHMLASRALLFPSEWYEGQPMAVTEAMAAGLPVLGSDLGGVAELVGRIGSGWLVQQATAAAWADAFVRLENGADIARASGAARLEFEQRFDSVSGLANLEGVYRLAAEIRAAHGASGATR